jgi:hypothetical protein
MSARPDDFADDLDPQLPPEDQLPPDDQALLDDQARQQQEDQRTVPLATLLEERRKLQAQLDEERARAQRFERLEAELRAMREQRNQPPPAEPEPPTPAPEYLEDPKGYVDHRVQEAVQALKKVEGTATQAQQLAQQQAIVAQVRTAVAAAEAEFSAKTADYHDALAHLRNVRLAQAKLMFPDAPEAAILQALDRDELQFAAQQLQTSKNPAELAYAMAKTLGYQPKQVQNPPQDGQRRGGDAPPAERRRLQGMGGAAAGTGEPDSELDKLMSGEADEFDQAMAELFPRRR